MKIPVAIGKITIIRKLQRSTRNCVNERELKITKRIICPKKIVIKNPRKPNEKPKKYFRILIPLRFTKKIIINAEIAAMVIKIRPLSNPAAAPLSCSEINPPCCWLTPAIKKVK